MEFLIGLVIIFALIVALVFYSNLRAAKERVDEILTHQSDWGSDVCNNLIDRIIELNMTDEMVKLSLGKPSIIDSVETSAKGTKFRWVYGTPRKDANYIWFKDGKVIKIKA